MVDRLEHEKSKNSVVVYPPFRIFGIFMGEEKERIIESLSLLILSGMPIISALEAINEEVHSKAARRFVHYLEDEIKGGSPLWLALKKTGVYPSRTISLIKVGEQSGRLVANLKVVATQQQKDRIFRSKLRAAALYPMVVLALSILVSIGIAWFVLPRLAVVFSELDVELPFMTNILVSLGEFFGKNGSTVLPIFVVLLFSTVYFLFFFPKTKMLGQRIVLSLPGIRRLVVEMELARFGLVLGGLLEAGTTIVDAFEALEESTDNYSYKRMYAYLKGCVETGNSLKSCFATFKGSKRLIPPSVQEIVATAEKAGGLSKTLLKIGRIFEAKADLTARNLVTLLEPILVIFVWLCVLAIALAVILPVYSLIGGFRSATGMP